MFNNESQVDVFTVLLLLGEASIWKAIWGRFRSSRRNWRQWIFAISLGWAPLAFNIFASLNGSDGPPNLIFDKPPDEVVDSRLMLTHLSSGATHPATNVVLQNIWNAWKKGPRNKQRERIQIGSYNRSKETGIVDVDIKSLQLYNNFGLKVHLICLVLQFLMVIVVGSVKEFTYEPLVALFVALAGQFFLLVSITPRQEAWMLSAPKARKPCPIMLHRTLESSSVLIVRAASSDGIQITLEEFCFESCALRNHADNFQLFCAGLSCIALTMHIVLVSWMTNKNKLLYFAAGLVGLTANVAEGASEPDWAGAYKVAFKGVDICSPIQSGLMAAVAVLIAGRFPAGIQGAKHLYPDNTSFDQTLRDLGSLFDGTICNDCRMKLNPDEVSLHDWNVHNTCRNRPKPCVVRLVDALNDTPATWENKQRREAIYSIYHCIRRFAPLDSSYLPQRLIALDQSQNQLDGIHMTHNWHPAPLQSVITSNTNSSYR